MKEHFIKEKDQWFDLLEQKNSLKKSQI